MGGAPSVPSMHSGRHRRSSAHGHPRDVDASDYGSFPARVRQASRACHPRPIVFIAILIPSPERGEAHGTLVGPGFVGTRSDPQIRIDKCLGAVPAMGLPGRTGDRLGMGLVAGSAGPADWVAPHTNTGGWSMAAHPEDPREDPRVDIVMITHNRIENVIESLDQLTRLAERPRIVVVDNGSTDGTAEAVAERFPQVEVLDAGGNLGAAARTIGVQHVEAPYVAFCDDDTWWESGCLRRAADLFGAAVPGRYHRPGSRRTRGPGGPDLPRARAAPCRVCPACRGPRCWASSRGPRWYVARRFWKRAGSSPVSSSAARKRCSPPTSPLRGHWLCYVPELVVHHHPSRLRDGHTRRVNLVRNALWFAWLRRPLPIAMRATLGLAWQRPWDRATVRGLVAALGGLPWALSRRRVLPPEVERGLRLLEARR